MGPSQTCHPPASYHRSLWSAFSSIWIVVANSWMQTPTGYKIVGRRSSQAEIVDFWVMVFNPSAVDRVIHVWSGSLAGFHCIKRAFITFSRADSWISPKSDVSLSSQQPFSPLAELYSGSREADIVTEYQPAKLAAFEGVYVANEPAPIYLFGWVDNETQEVTGLSILGGLSFLVSGDFDTPVKGLNYFPKTNAPSQRDLPLYITIMIGQFLIFISLLGCFQLWRELFQSILIVFVFTAILPQIANQCGWFAAEMGRQPWVVYRLLTSEGFSQAVTANQIVFSLILFFVIYALLFLLFLYTLTKKIRQGPVFKQKDTSPQKLLATNNPT